MAYTTFDRFVAWCRYRAALPFVKPGARVCDVGCGLDAGFLRYAGLRVRFGVGLDDQLSSGGAAHPPMVRANITARLPLQREKFDHVVMLAVLEHLPNPEPVLGEAFRLLVPGGSLILTWPQGMIDPFLHTLHRMGIVSDEMESQEHQKRIPVDALVRMLEQIGFRQMMHRRFEFGLNNLLVAVRPR
jgi:2-polyprenyl-3-methyl-5-hydroxy-6-metoxy-1,4-benzoquinol methylase